MHEALRHAFNTIRCRGCIGLRKGVFDMPFSESPARYPPFHRVIIGSPSPRGREREGGGADRTKHLCTVRAQPPLRRPPAITNITGSLHAKSLFIKAWTARTDTTNGRTVVQRAEI